MRAYGRFVARNARLVLVTCALVMAAFVFFGSQVFTALIAEGFDDPGSEAQRADRLLTEHFGGEQNLVVMVTAPDGESVDDPAALAVGQEVTQRLRDEGTIGAIAGYVDAPAPILRSSDGSSGLVVGTMTKDLPDTIEELRDDLTGERADGVEVYVGGSEAIGEDIGSQVLIDLGKAEAVAIPLTLILLLIVFGSFVSAMLPLATGAFAVFGAFYSVFVVTRFTEVSIFSINLITGMGVGLAIDYGLLIVSRYREELAKLPEAERSDKAALTRVLETTLDTAGRTVLYTGLAVSVSLSVLLVFPIPFLRSFGFGGVAVVAVSCAGALTLLPALLALLGPKVDSGRVRRRKRGVRAASEVSPFWRRVGEVVYDRPWLAVPGVLVLVVLATPMSHATFGSPDDRVLNTDAQSRTVGDAIRDDFPPTSSEAPYVVVEGADQAGLDAYAAAASEVPGVQSVSTWTGQYVGGQRQDTPDATTPAEAQAQWQAQQTAALLQDGDVSLLRVTGPLDGASAQALDLVRALRALEAPPGATVSVGGYPAALVDNRTALTDRLPLAAALIALITFLLIFAFTRSLLVPLKALVLNVLTLAAVLGSMTWIFQDGNLSGLLGFEPGPLDTSMPVLLFCIAFGLSMDYELFLIARIKEAHDHGDGMRESVVGGLSRTARITTTAAAILAITFVAFGTSRVTFIQLFGIGTAMAIVLDATLVRAVLVPAFMRLAGRANWWAPRFLQGRAR